MGEVDSLLRPGSFQSGYGRLRMLRFLAQVAPGPGCGLRGASREDSALPMQGTRVRSRIRKLDPTCCN